MLGKTFFVKQKLEFILYVKEEQNKRHLIKRTSKIVVTY